MTTTPSSVKGDPFAGATLGGRYRVDDLIGRGGMATVYRGVDLSLGRPVAVKVFAEAAEGIDDAERRRSETALLASLAHRALVRLYDAARDDETGREFLVMELVEGRDLREALKLGPLSPADAAGLLADLAEGLHVIHDRGIVHRDVKPANVLLEPAHLPTRTWNAKLADFGIARLIDDARLTRTGLLVGTPGYLSPEQVNGRPPTPAADVYSLGLLVLEARTGVTAFPGPAVEAASARLARDPDIPESLGPDWVALLRTMTAREPADRPTALEVAVAATQLDTAASDDPGATAPTLAFTDAAGPDTVAVTPAAPTSDDTVAVTPAVTTPGDAADATAATRVLPTPDRSFFATPAAARPDAEAASSRSQLRAQARATGDRERNWVRPLIAIGLLLAVLGVAAWIIIGALSAPTAAPELEPLPAVPGDLGVHLEQLDQAVTGGG
ncbi:serine/threonine-protein kinase [Agromyces mariniharenae]|uniref:non-specific serine/threonine protein kinase n=1 Tax=Agromyces mariniharenae TaxID=2604423 RepID=A0A5S4V8W7_9MICO|nr:serine/threonine-protein kinase [Agromyces mariniharenae]TYL53771.1 serine/threonine protein kinase [Agromyces mariniharenae]